MNPTAINKTCNAIAAMVMGCLLSPMLSAAEPVTNGNFDPALIDSPVQDQGGSVPAKLKEASEAEYGNAMPAADAPLETTADIQHRPLGKQSTTIIESGPTTPLTAPITSEEPSIETSQQAAVEPAHDSNNNVRRALFTSGITDREPIDDLISLSNEISKVYFFTEIRGLAGQKIVHRWMFQDEIFADVEFSIGGPRWRVWSSKNLPANYVGEWKVLVIDEQDTVLSSSQLVYTDSASH